MKPSSMDNTVADKSIDLIITYVNGSDRQWINDYIKYTKTHNPSAVRFRSWGTLIYLLRGVAEYMPFIRNVVLVVARPSQVPIWINEENVRIVYHDEFIPKEFLPTFNSCTIESFFWNISGLADRVIYLNDDMFPNAPVTEEDFFTDNIPHIKFTEPHNYANHNIFRCQCRSSMDFITKALGIPSFTAGQIIRPYHISGIMTHSCFDAISKLGKDDLPNTISRLRLKSNVNQYIYSYYYYFTNNYIDDVVDYAYYEIGDKSILEINKDISDSIHKMICINDSDKIKEFAQIRYLLTNAFNKKFPHRCKYEK